MELQNIEVRKRTRATRPSKSVDPFLAQIDDALSTAEADLPGHLPQDLGERVRFLRKRADSGLKITYDLHEFLYTTLLRLKQLNLPLSEIARQLGWHENSVVYHMKPAREWFAKHLGKRLDPFELLMSEMIKLDMLDERALTKAMAGNVSVGDLHKMIAASTKVSDTRAEWLNKYGYFDAVNFHRMRGGDSDSAEARADVLRRALWETFDDDSVQPVAIEHKKDQSDVEELDEMDEWPDDD